MEANSLALNPVIFGISIVIDALLTLKISRLLASMSYQNCSKYILRKVYTPRNSSRPTTPKEAFYSKLNNAHISDKEYEYAQYVWKKAGCKLCVITMTSISRLMYFF